MDVINAIGNFLAESRNFYFYLALAGSVMFVVQLLLMLFGGAADADADAADFEAADIDLADSSGISLVSFFSLRSMLAFVTFFGWAGFFWGGSGWLGFAVSFGCGLLMMVLTTLLVWFFFKMQQSGNIAEEDFIGRDGKVYVSIPADGAGSVTVKFENCTRTVRAVADSPIAAGTIVKVVSSAGFDTYKVEKN
jgi:membrane protein implicated in regulation of membrane protease activity